MKKVLVFTLPLLLLSVSCEKIEQAYSRSYGSDIVFGPSSNHGVDTKASYSGTTTSLGYERIDWNLNDTIRIYCAQASAPECHYHDYFVSEAKSDGSSSTAKLDHNPDAVGLQWGNENVTHCFTALCPAPGHGESGIDVTENKVTCVLPATQTYGTLTPSSGNYTASPNSKYIYLAGYGTADPKAEDTPVQILFDPAMTTFEITLQNGYESKAAMTIKQAGITTADGNLVGTYTVNVTGITSTDTLQKSAIGTSGLSGKTITMNFSASEKEYVEIAYGNSISFTLFTHPGYDITKLTFWMVDNGDVKRSFDFKYTDPSKGTEGWVNFKAFHKSKITGLVAKESIGWTINTLPMVAEWGQNPEDLEIESGNVISFTSPVVVTWNNDGEQGSITYSE